MNDGLQFELKQSEYSNTIGYCLTKYYGIEEILTIPNMYDNQHILHIEKNVFKNKTLKKITLPNKLISIGAAAFLDCQKLETIQLPESLEYIGVRAFDGCKNLKEIVIPKSVKYLPYNIFLNCLNLEKITVLNEDIVFDSKISLNTNNLKEVNFCLLKYLKSKNQLMVIDYKFQNFIKLDFDEQEKYISFIKKNRSLINEILMSNKAELISILLDNIKLNLDELNEFIAISIENTYTEITAIFLEYKNKTFTKEQIEQYDENNSLVEIGLELPTLKQLEKKWIFSHNENEISIQGYKGYNSNEILISKTIDGYNITEINFKTTNLIENLIIEYGIKSIGNHAFLDSKLSKITLPNSIIKIGVSAFMGSFNLEEIVFPKTLKKIESNAFFNCFNLRVVTFNSNVILEDDAFKQCSNFKIIKNLE